MCCAHVYLALRRTFSRSPSLTSDSSQLRLSSFPCALGMTAPPMRTVSLPGGVALTIVTLIDRRDGASGSPEEWAYQLELENYLYSNWQTKGSFFKLLARAGADGQSLCLRRKAVEEGLVSDAELVALRNVVNPAARAFTLVPLGAIERALTTYGKTPRAEALATALHLDSFSEEGEEGELEGEGEEREEGELEAEGEEGEEGDDDGNSDEEEEEEEGGAGASSSGGAAGPSGAAQDGNDAYPDTEEEEEPGDVEGGGSKGGKAPQRSTYALSEVPPELEAELAALDQWRLSPINMSRKGVAVTEMTSKVERANLLRLLGWLVHEKKLPRPTLNAFGSAQIGTAVELYIKCLVEGKGRKYSTVARYLVSFIAAAHFVHAQRTRIRLSVSPTASAVSSKPIDDLKSLHAQVLQMARQEATFDLSKPSKQTLDWAGVQRARCRAEEAMAALGKEADPARREELTRDVAIMMCLTHQAPDRVGVWRCARLGGTLKHAANGGLQLDLSEPGDHKTIAAFGPSITTVPAAITAALKRHIALAAVPHMGYVFSASGNPYEPLESYQWTRLIQAMFKRYSGVALAPKDLRSSHVTWLKTGQHDDETLRSAAHAMRHSSKTQDSAAYNKGKSDRLVQKSVDAAAAFAATFRPTGGEGMREK